MIERVTHPAITGIAHGNYTTFAALLSDGCYPSMSTQSLVISFSKRPRGLGEHRGGYDSSHSWQGPEDLDVAVLALLAVIIALDDRELIQQGVQARAAALALGVNQTQAWQQQGNMFGGGLNHPRGDVQRGSPQDGKHSLRIQTANAVLTQQPFDSFTLQPARAGRRGRQLKQRPQPGFVSRRTQLKRLNIEAVKLFTQAVGQPNDLTPKVLINPGEFAQLNHQRIVQMNPTKAGPIGAQRVTQDQRIAAVVFGARCAMTVAKTIKLLGVDGVKMKPVLDQGFHYRTPRNLDRDGGLSRVTSGKFMQPLCEGCNRLTSMRKRSLSKHTSSAVQHAGLMGFSRPVDADINPILILHNFLLHCCLYVARRRLMPHHPCTGARGATPHRTCTNG